MTTIVPVSDAPNHGVTLRVPPHAYEAECSVLGGLLLQSGEAWDRVGDLLTAEDFYRHEHKLIFSAIGVLANSMREADVVTVYNHLVNQGQGDEAGGIAYLNSLAQYVPSASNIRRYAEIVRERAILRRLASVGDQICAAAFDATGKPVRERLQEAERLVFEIDRESQREDAGPTDLHNLVTQLLDLVQARADNPSDVIGLPTGFHDLDRMTTGLQAGDLVILAARPSMGKTSLAMNIAEHVAIHEGLPVAVFSLEMGSLQLVSRMVGSIGRIDQTRLRKGTLLDDEWGRLTEALEKLRNCAMEVDETPGLSISEIRSRARRIARKYNKKLGLIVVDYLQLMAVNNDENRATALGEASRGLKLLAKEMGCPVIALSQLSRGVESRTDKRPMMSDLRESGAIEQDADVISFIYRDDYYNKDSKEPGVAEVIIAKQRNGPTGTVKLAWLSAITRFESLARHD
jgi:replicative DNA helicase